MLKIGDQVWFYYGRMFGTDIGTVVGIQGTQALVRKSDSTIEPVALNVEDVFGEVVPCDFEGEPYFITRGAIPPVGTYRIVHTPSK